MKMQTAAPGILAGVELLNKYSISYWLDSGSLLGLVRDGAEIAWDSDIDLGIWDVDMERLLEVLPEIKRSGYKVSVRRYRGLLYGCTIRNINGNEMRPIHVHVYFRHGDLAWSPQTVLFSPVGRGEKATVGFAPWPALRRQILYLRDEARQRKTNKVPLLQRIWRWGVCLPLWGGFVVVRNRFDREHWCSVWPFSVLYAMYTWVVPARHFETLDTKNIAGMEVSVPSEVETYLQLRYYDWRKPVRDWCYWTDDGCIRPAPPEEVIDFAKAEQA
ncbi:LicD family protein [Desulfurivibrio dismutans]|uniref:LicD family protein n=1 Tax=Desulfurivibrio dismutans TaxID=1398908 RepID=UPI0023DA1542|nr:LicD family protein [Desulfurivibrio alkaliphilus]MDF1615236.1 LicD family protein [Desulfurivibrio alkaliphilus]